MPVQTELLFSVVIPVLNERTYLPRCLEALERQQFDHNRFELIFVDNGSTDGSIELLESYARNSTLKLTVLHEAHRDAYIARNRGIAAAAGQYIAFTDADCAAVPDWLALFAQEIAQSSPGILVGRLSFPPGCPPFVRYYEAYYATKMRLVAEHLPRECCSAHAGNMVVRTDLFASLGLFSGMQTVGDAEIVQKFLRRYPDQHIAYLDSAAVVHHEVTGSRDLLRKLYRYGGYTESLRRSIDFRPAEYSGKVLTFSRCVTDHGYALPQQITLAGVLVVQQAASSAGRYATKLGFALKSGAQRTRSPGTRVTGN